MTKGQGLRQYRACTRCRSRKTRCDLLTVGDPGKPPCSKCFREGQGSECRLAGSRRGGDFTQYRRARNAPRPNKVESARRTAKTSTEDVSPRQYTKGEAVHDNLQNPSDALLILAHAAEQPGDDAEPGELLDNQSVSQPSLGDSNARYSQAAGHRHQSRAHSGTRLTAAEENEQGLRNYPLIRDGTLSLALVGELLIHYSQRYHQFMPLAPASALQPGRLPDTIRNESFLLTAVLVIASKDRPDLSEAHNAIWNYMRQLILDVVLGVASVRRVGCVEGLLLLGEWTSFDQGQNSDGGEGASWSILGLAVRLAYLLRLEDSSFKITDEEPDSVTQRERLAWTFTYLCDRQISIRMGQAFWCRGPALSARFTAQDFPTLQPHQQSDEDFASLLQAQVELTTLFGNAHDILFASKSRTAELMVRGDYTKYVDDTVRAMTAWFQAWQLVSVSTHLRTCLFLMYEYLRLYVNAFAFQAVLYRESTKNPAFGPSSFPSSIMASPDARHIYAAIDAAEKMLIMAVEEIEPENHLRYMPARFYLYEIHAAVFLYKAHAVGAIDWEKHAQTTALMQRFTAALRIAATEENHISFRYARLLERLWIQRHPAEIENGHRQTGNQGMADPLALIGPDMISSQMPLFEDIGLQPFDCSDTFEALFSMPPVFPADQPGLF